MAPSAPADTGGLQEIVVTAQRRSENLKDVPIAITAVPPQRLEQLNLRTVDSIQQVTPGLVFNNGINYAQNFIRGIGSNFPNPGLEPAVATYVDGAYLERGFGSLFDILDPESIQVLKGPQGTLWGRNATGGAILINSANPTDKFEGHVQGEYGNLGHYLGEAVVNAPISDTFAVRVAGRYRSDGGYVYNLADGRRLGGRRDLTLRGKASWKPTSNFTAIAEVQYDKDHGSTQPDNETLSGVNCLHCGSPGSSSPPAGFYESDVNVKSPHHDITDRSTFANLHLRYDGGAVKIESVTAYRNQKDYAGTDQDFTGYNGFYYQQFSGSKTFTQDFTVTTDTGTWYNAVFGLDYLHDKSYFNAAFSGGDFQPLIDSFGQLPGTRNTVITQSVSAFGELTIEPIQHLKLIAGGRYSYDQRHFYGADNDAGYIGFAGGVGPQSYRANVNFGSFTPRFVISYDFGQVNVYASYNKGFKAGGFSTPAFTPPTTVKPEKIESYEGGIKFASRDRKLRANVAGFYYKYTDVQVTVIRLDLGGAIIQNAATATGRGAEFDMEYQPVKWLQIFAGGSYLDARYKNFPGASVVTPTPTGLSNLIPEDLSGYPLARAPKWSGFLGATVSSNLGPNWKGDLTGFVHYTSRYDFSAGAGGPLGTDYQPKMALANLSGNVGPASGQWSVGFFIDNLTNKKYYQFRQISAPYGAYGFVAPPRTYGGRLRFNF